MERIAREGGDMTLKTYVATNWRTPAASDPEGGIEDWSTERFQNIDTPQIKLRDQAANWTTPLADDTNTRTNKFAQGGTPLSMQAKNWPTVTPNRATYSNGKRGPNLIEEAKQWPTASARDYKGFDPPGKKNTRMDPDLYLSIHQGQETEKDGHSCSPSCRRLNPLFAEHLMGLPLGWTCVSEPLAMESFQQWQLVLSENLQTS